MKKYLVFLCAILMAFGIAVTAHAAPLDLSSWSALTLDFAGGQPSGNWILEPGNQAVVQTVNADPSFYLNNINQTGYSMDGTWEVLTSYDDDYMGFVFGYQNSSNFYLFDWKQVYQYANTAIAMEGMAIKKMTGATGDGLVDLSLSEFWENAGNYGDMTLLANYFTETAGWADNTLYSFHLDFNLNPGEIHVVVKDSSDIVLWDVTVYDTTFTSGQFGFYNFSQEQVRYAGFEQTGGTTVPEPASMLLLGLSLAGLAVLRKKAKK